MLTHRLKFILITFLFVANQACQSNSLNKEKSVEEITNASKITNESIVRNPAGAEIPEDTINIAKIKFEEKVFNFGEVMEGELVSHIYHFTNVGKAPLVISNARSTCGCTVPEWPKDPIEPGKHGTIEVKFNTNGKRNNQRKPIYITANTYPATSEVYLEGMVNPKDPEATPPQVNN